MRANNLIIPLIMIVTALVGSWFSSRGVQGWYQTINKPSFTPPGSVIGMVWTAIFILSTIAALLVWNDPSHTGNADMQTRYLWIGAIFVLNAILNVLWSYLFFEKHRIFAAVWEAIALDLTVIVLIVLIWPISRWASALLMPYAGWGAFASYLTYAVWTMNRG
jgi:tryptophan-rich sensory protein